MIDVNGFQNHPSQEQVPSGSPVLNPEAPLIPPSAMPESQSVESTPVEQLTGVKPGSEIPNAKPESVDLLNESLEKNSKLLAESFRRIENVFIDIGKTVLESGVFSEEEYVAVNELFGNSFNRYTEIATIVAAQMEQIKKLGDLHIKNEEPMNNLLKKVQDLQIKLESYQNKNKALLDSLLKIKEALPEKVSDSKPEYERVVKQSLKAMNDFALSHLKTLDIDSASSEEEKLHLNILFNVYDKNGFADVSRSFTRVEDYYLAEADNLSDQKQSLLELYEKDKELESKKPKDQPLIDDNVRDLFLLKSVFDANPNLYEQVFEKFTELYSYKDKLESLEPYLINKNRGVYDLEHIKKVVLDLAKNDPGMILDYLDNKLDDLANADDKLIKKENVENRVTVDEMATAAREMSEMGQDQEGDKTGGTKASDSIEKVKKEGVQTWEEALKIIGPDNAKSIQAKIEEIVALSSPYNSKINKIVGSGYVKNPQEHYRSVLIKYLNDFYKVSDSIEKAVGMANGVLDMDLEHLKRDVKIVEAYENAKSPEELSNFYLENIFSEDSKVKYLFNEFKSSVVNWKSPYPAVDSFLKEYMGVSSLSEENFGNAIKSKAKEVILKGVNKQKAYNDISKMVNDYLQSVEESFFIITRDLIRYSGNIADLVKGNRDLGISDQSIRNMIISSDMQTKLLSEKDEDKTEIINKLKEIFNKYPDFNEKFFKSNENLDKLNEILSILGIGPVPKHIESSINVSDTNNVGGETVRSEKKVILGEGAVDEEELQSEEIRKGIAEIIQGLRNIDLQRRDNESVKASDSISGVIDVKPQDNIPSPKVEENKVEVSEDADIVDEVTELSPDEVEIVGDEDEDNFTNQKPKYKMPPLPAREQPVFESMDKRISTISALWDKTLDRVRKLREQGVDRVGNINLLADIFSEEYNLQEKLRQYVSDKNFSQKNVNDYLAEVEKTIIDSYEILNKEYESRREEPWNILRELKSSLGSSANGMKTEAVNQEKGKSKENRELSLSKMIADAKSFDELEKLIRNNQIVIQGSNRLYKTEDLLASIKIAKQGIAPQYWQATRNYGFREKLMELYKKEKSGEQLVKDEGIPEPFLLTKDMMKKKPEPEPIPLTEDMKKKPAPVVDKNAWKKEAIFGPHERMLFLSDLIKDLSKSYRAEKDNLIEIESKFNDLSNNLDNPSVLDAWDKFKEENNIDAEDLLKYFVDEIVGLNDIKKMYDNKNSFGFRNSVGSAYLRVSDFMNKLGLTVGAFRKPGGSVDARSYLKRGGGISAPNTLGNLKILN